MKIDRLIGILSTLLQKDKITSQEPASIFEVSRRTILCDVDANVDNHIIIDLSN